jgi:serine protease AprX
MSISARSRDRRRRRLSASALLCAGLAALSASTVAADPADGPAGGLPPAEIHRPSGIEGDQLTHGPGREDVRVAILLDRQPVLEETTKPGYEAALSGYTRGDLQAAARRNREGVSALEVRTARSAERRRTAIVSELQDEIADAERAQRPVERAVRALGGTVVAEETSGALAMVTARVERRDLAALADRGDVQAIVEAPKPEPELNTSTTTIAASPVWPQHNGGADPDGPAGGAADVRTGLEVGMGGDSPDPSHSAFSGISISMGGANPADHGTATTGVLVSRDPTYRGVAPGVAALRAGNADVFGAPDPVEVRSQSFGYSPTSDDNANVPDLQADTFAVPWAASAGNANDDPGVTPGTPQTGGDAMGRNILSVGALGDNSTATEADNLVADFSSFGPTPGGRKKPDLTAPGVAITSPDFGTGGFDPETGTSLAAPHVGGALAILAGAGMTDPRAMRAVLINSAQPWCNGHNHNPPTGTQLTTAYPSGTCQNRWLPDVGWGELDVEDAIAERGNAVVGEVGAGKARFYRATADPGERVTLAWNMRGVLGQFVHEHVYFAVTNLNLRQYRPDGTEISALADPGWGAGPDSADPNDTVEQVRSPSPGGQLVYKVSADSTIEGRATERFGLASANALTPLESPDVDPTDLSQTGQGPVNCASDTVTVTARLANPSSDLEATGSQLTLELPAGLELVSGSATQAVSAGTLAVDETSEEVSWTVRATGSGSHTPVVRGEGTAYGTTFTNRENLAAIAADCSPPRVAPTDVSVSPASDVTCGQVQTISAAFRNPTLTDAPGARASLSFGSGVELVAGPQTQAVSGGTLGRGQTSAAHSWQVRLPTPQLPGGSSSGVVTVTGANDANPASESESVTLRCTRSSDPPPSTRGTVRLEDEELVYNRRTDKVTASGRLAKSRSGDLSGFVELEFQRPAPKKNSGSKRISRTAELAANGRFSARIGACREGRYKAWVRWEGNDDFQPLARTAIDRVRSSGC